MKNKVNIKDLNRFLSKVAIQNLDQVREEQYWRNKVYIDDRFLIIPNSKIYISNFCIYCLISSLSLCSCFIRCVWICQSGHNSGKALKYWNDAFIRINKVIASILSVNCKEENDKSFCEISYFNCFLPNWKIEPVSKIYRPLEELTSYLFSASKKFMRLQVC